MSGVQRGFGTSGNRPRQMVRGLGIGGGRSGLGGGGGGALQNLTNNPTSRPHHVPKLDSRQNSTTVRISQQAQENPHGAEIATVQRKIKDINKMLRQTGHALPDRGAKFTSQIAELQTVLAKLEAGAPQGHRQVPGKAVLPEVKSSEPSSTVAHQPNAAAAIRPPPLGWRVAVSTKGITKGKRYYTNNKTGQSQWGYPTRTRSDETPLPPRIIGTTHIDTRPLNRSKENRVENSMVAPKEHRIGAITVLTAPPSWPMRKKVGKAKWPRSTSVFVHRTGVAGDKLGREVVNILGAVPPPSRHGAVVPSRLVVSLLAHQVPALEWLRWREHPDQPVRGGILADDMGLGKTVEILALIAGDTDVTGTTLVVCPASVILQWKQEIMSKLADARVVVFHGASRDTVSFSDLGSRTVVITTYDTLARAHTVKSTGHSSPFTIKWYRVVLDEGHLIRNGKTKMSNACCELDATSRWVVTGSPLNNNPSEMHTLLGRFLRCGALADRGVWKKQIDAAGKVGQDRLRALLGGLLLRRLKSDVTATGTPLVDLPSRHHVQHTLTLNPAERAQYQLILGHGREAIRTTGGCDALVRLNHLRQICCDPTLISKAPADAQPTCANVADLAMSLDRMSLYDTGSSITSTSAEKSSTKIKAVVTLTESLVTTISPEGLHNKAIIVSQWTGFLDLIAAELDRHGLKHVRLDGSVEVGRRQTIVDTFNSAVGTSDSPPPVLLLSLKAGGVGLNLVGANHCLVADLPYNPATLDQACDRIYRLGQKRSVTIHKFICANTIEEWQLRLLAKKRSAMDRVLHDTASEVLTKVEIRDLFEDRWR
eukprot:m.118376 g.118376  ORF g.118376 m.118376 type:complete len:823 (-) comp21723_c0_seq1:569-3037(-)